MKAPFSGDVWGGGEIQHNSIKAAECITLLNIQVIIRMTQIALPAFLADCNQASPQAMHKRQRTKERHGIDAEDTTTGQICADSPIANDGKLRLPNSSMRPGKA